MEKDCGEEEIIADFSEALLNHEFKPYIQPKYNIFDHRFYGGEVLCRWIHKGVMISPVKFIPVLEENGLILKLDRYMFVETLKILSGWIAQDITPVPLSVNLSRVNFYQENLAQEMLDTIEELKVPHSLIQIEITESAYVELEDRVMEFVDIMRQNEIEILMDDFGSGYSSLNMLKDIDISILKVDYRFLTKSRIPSRREKILESIVKLARTIDVPLIIEGVEKEQDAALLKGLGVRYVQGFLYGRPMPVIEFENLSLVKELRQEKIMGYGAPVMEELFKLDSSTRLIFENSLSGMAICEYSNSELYIIQMNKALQRAEQMNLNELKHARNNVLEYVAEYDKERTIKYINDVCQQMNQESFIETDFYTPLCNTHIKLGLSLLAQRGNDYILLLDVVILYQHKEKSGNSGLFELLEGLDRGYYIMGENHDILYSNPRAREILPNFTPGVRCTDYKRYDEDCNQCPLDNYDMIMSYYSQNLNTFVENYVTQIQLNGKKVKLVRIDTNAHEMLNNSDSVMRMNHAIARTGDVYTEVDLETLEYNQITFAKRKIFDVPAIGFYDKSFKETVEKRIDKKFAAEVIDCLSSEAMRRDFLDGRKVKVRYKFADIDAWAEAVGTFIRDGDKRYCCIYTRDVTNDVLRDYDPLTGILNGSAAKRLINECFVKYPNQKAALFMLDFNNFKGINDTYGHPFGDKVLIEFANVLKSILPESDYVARLGGDEFIVFANDALSFFNVEQLKKCIEEKAKDLSSQLEIDTLTRVSIGVAMYPVDGQTFAELYSKVDKSMYQNK